MATLRDIRRRIRSVENTRKITRAMKLVSAAKLRRAQEQIFAARPYDDRLRQIIGEILLRGRVDLHPLLQAREGPNVLLMVIASDRGLCGGLNTNIFKLTQETMDGLGDSRIQLLLVGKRSVDKFDGKNWVVMDRFIDVYRDLTVRTASLLAEKMVRSYLEGELDRVIVVYPNFRSPLIQKIEAEELLPLRSESFLEAVRPISEEGDYRIVPPRFEYDPGPQEVLSHLLPRHVQSRVWRLLLESQASDHGARMTAMDNATTNAEEMIGQLTLAMNRARQAAITRELIEIVSGADALENQ